MKIDKDYFIKNIKFWNWKTYKYNRIGSHKLSDNTLLKHLLKYGIKKNYKIVLDKNNKNIISNKCILNNLDLLLPNDFNYKNYINLYNDLQNMNENEAKIHYILYGNYESREYKSKYKSKYKSNYNIIKQNKNEVFINNKLWAHIHCYDIDKFDEIYGEYIFNIMKYFSVVVTYCIGESKNKSTNFCLLRCDNNSNIINDFDNLEKINHDFNFLDNLSFFHNSPIDILFTNNKILLSYDTLLKVPNFDSIYSQDWLFNFILENDLNYCNNDEYLFIENYLNSFINSNNITLRQIILYKSFHPDLIKLNLEKTIHHYLNHRINENRYMNNDCDIDLYNYRNNIKNLYLIENEIPIDFNWKTYFFMNNLYDDKELLLKISQNNNYFINIAEHYKKNKLSYHSEINVYDYSYFNHDLGTKLKNLHLIYKHYFTHGKRELRKIINRNKNNNSLFNNCIIFINHDSSLTGAPIFLYDFIIYLERVNFFSNIILLEPYPNNDLKFKLKVINSKIIYFYNNENILEEIIRNYNPNLIYSNSVCIFNIDRFKKYQYKTIFHYHETYNVLNTALSGLNIKLTNRDINSFKTYVVSDLIQKEYKKNSIICDVFPPFLSNEKIDILNNIKKTNLSKNIYNNDFVFGMCGTKSKRKGYDIFLEVVKKLPQFKFIWIGGSVDTSNQYDNYIQIPHTNDPYTIILQDIDYMMITSREDPCPFVILESLYLNTPCIILENNIKYNHKIDSNYYVISEHNNDSNKIVEYINQMSLTKKNIQNNHNLEEYITKNFIKPKFLQNMDINIINNKICVFLSLYNISDGEIDYYKNIINILNLTYDFHIDIILLINTGDIFNNNFNYIECDNYTLFGVDHSELINELYLRYSKIKNSKIIFVPNKGTDWGPFLIGLDYCGNNYEYIIKLHSKTNIYWREMIMNIIYKNVFKINENNNYDTFIQNKWYDKTNIYSDDNLKLLLDRNDIFNITEEEWYYPQGSIFITKYKNLITLTNNFTDIYNYLNDENSYDKLWIEQMDNNEIFKNNYNHFSKSNFNKDISKDANIMRQKYKCKNYFELIKKGYRGIPDFSTNYALERYLGYLICLNKNIYFFE